MHIVCVLYMNKYCVHKLLRIKNKNKCYSDNNNLFVGNVLQSERKRNFCVHTTFHILLFESETLPIKLIPLVINHKTHSKLS